MTGPIQNTQPGASSFIHPSFGNSIRNDAYVCIRWRSNASAEAKNNLLNQLGLTLADADDETRQPAMRINQTSGVSWVCSKENAIANTTIAQLENSDMVEWVAAAKVERMNSRLRDSSVSTQLASISNRILLMP